MRIPSGVGGKFPTQKPAIDKVAEHIDDVVTVAESITSGQFDKVSVPEVKAVATSIKEVKQVAEVEQYVRILAQDLSNIDLIGSQLAGVLNVSNNMAVVLLLHSRMADLLDIKKSLVHIDAVALNEERINSVYEIIPEIATLVSHMDSLVRMARVLPQLETVFENLDVILLIGSNVGHIVNVSTNMETILEASVYVNEIYTLIEQIKESEAHIVELEASSKVNAEEAAKQALEAKAQMVEATKQAGISATQANAAKGSATQAAGSATSADAAYKKAVTSESNAKVSETNAANSASAALVSKNAAKVSETNAASSATLAKASEDDVAANAGIATDKALEAKGYADSASASKVASAASQVAAKSSEDKAKASETASASSAAKALVSEGNAKKSEDAAKASEGVVAASALAAKASEDNAKLYEADARASMMSAASSATTAGTNANLATAEANKAKGYAAEALTSKNAAASSATTASTGATTATTKASEASSSASAAKVSQDAAKVSEVSAADSLSKIGSAIADAEVPYPDVWIPFNNDLHMEAGYGTNKVRIGSDTLTMPEVNNVDFTRASTATYIDKSGVLRTAGINEPRFEKEGLLIEGQSTNTHVYSDYTLSNFNKMRCSCELSDLEGGIQWYKQIATEGTSTAYVYLQGGNSQTFEVGKTYTYSVIVKKGTTSTFRVVKHDDSFPSDAVAVFSFDTETFSYVGVGLVSAQSTKLRDGVYRLAITATCCKENGRRSALIWQVDYTVGDYWFMANPQIEELPFASSYIPTNGAAATRAADRCSIPSSGNKGGFDRDVTYAAEYNEIGKSTTGYFFCFADGGYPTRKHIHHWSDNRISASNDYMMATVGAVPQNMSGLYAAAFDYGSGYITLRTPQAIAKSTVPCVNAPDQVEVPSDQLVLMSAGDERHIPFGHVRNFRIWHRALNDLQLKGLK